MKQTIGKPKFQYFVDPSTMWIYHAVPMKPIFQVDKNIPVFLPRQTLCRIQLDHYHTTTHIKPQKVRCDACTNFYKASISAHIGQSTIGVYMNDNKLFFHVANRIYRVNESTARSKGDTLYSLRVSNIKDRNDKFKTRGYHAPIQAWEELDRRIDGMDAARTTNLFDTIPYIGKSTHGDTSHLAMFD